MQGLVCLSQMGLLATVLRTYSGAKPDRTGIEIPQNLSAARFGYEPEIK